MATCYSILTWRIPQIEEPGGLQFMGSQRVRHDWATDTSNCKRLAFCPTPPAFSLSAYFLYGSWQDSFLLPQCVCLHVEQASHFIGIPFLTLQILFPGPVSSFLYNSVFGGIGSLKQLWYIHYIQSFSYSSSFRPISRDVALCGGGHNSTLNLRKTASPQLSITPGVMWIYLPYSAELLLYIPLCCT